MGGGKAKDEREAQLGCVVAALCSLVCICSRAIHHDYLVVGR